MSQTIVSQTIGVPAGSRVAADIMTRQVVSVTPTATVRDVARLLLAHRISAVPVLDTDGAPVGMVSEGDLLGRSDTDRLAGHDWWLALLADPDAAAPAVTDAAAARPVSEVMHAPVVTIEADAPVPAVAEALGAHGIKRLPVMRNGQMIGIVSRADLLAVVARLPAPAPPVAHRSGLAGLFLDLIGNAAHLAPAHAEPAPETTGTKAGEKPPAAPAASAFRALVAASDQTREDAKHQAARTAELERLRQVKALLQLHLDTEMWESLLAHANDAAAHGAEEMLLLRFPSELCSDGARRFAHL